MRNWNPGALFFGVLFILGGLLFAAGRIHPHLAAWRQMPQEEKENIRIHALCRNIGLMILLGGALFFLDGIWLEFRQHGFPAAMALWLLGAALDVRYIGKSSRYKRQ